MKALCSWATTDSAISLRSGTSDAVRGRSNFGVTPCLQRVTDSISGRSEFWHDSASLPQEAPVAKDFLGLTKERNLSKTTVPVTHLRMYSTHPPGRVQQYRFRGFYRFGCRHIFAPRRPTCGGLAWRPPDRPGVSALVQSRSWERGEPLGNARLCWPISSNNPIFEERS
jgi:hypothetical protein